MTDYELLSIFIEFTNTVWTIFATYVSIVFAFIIAAYLVSSRLTPNVVALVLSLYSLVSFWSIWAISQNAYAIAASVGEMKRVVQESDSSLGWVPQTAISDFMLPTLPIVITSLAFVVYVGSIVFFFYQRRIKWPTES